MIPRKKKICDECKTEQYIWAKGKCKDCHQRISMAERLQAKSSQPIRKIQNRTSGDNNSGFFKKRKPIYSISKKKKTTGEAVLFKQIWMDRPHVCVNCKISLGNEPKTFFFAHIKPKSIYPELRLDPNNIQLLCFDCHRAYDQGTKEQFEKRKNLFKHNTKR